MTKDERIAAERERLMNMYAFQTELVNGTRFVFGIDEAGRGPLCGPVVAGCCILPDDADILWLNDSKKISEKKREQIYEEIISKAKAYGVGIVSSERIDEINILNATMEAMTDAFENCLAMYRERVSESSALNLDDMDLIPSISDSICLIDGNRITPGIPFKQLAVVKGDAKCPSISAASIIAKVTRDRMLIEYDEKYPEYGFAKHKGYGTKEHVEAIRRYGVLDIHRRSFLKNILEN